MHEAVRGLTYVNIGAYIALGLVAVLVWRRRRDRAGMWAAAAFGSLGLLEIVSLFVPQHGGTLLQRALARIAIACFVLFPYLLFRFTGVFRDTRRRLGNALFGLTLVLLVWTFALPAIPRENETWSTAFAAFVVLFVAHWLLLAVLTTVRLWSAGRGQPSVARRRMQLLSFASAAIAVAIVLVASGGTHPAPQLAAQVLGLLALLSFYLGLAPPFLVRLWWRVPEQARLQEAVASLLTLAESQREVAARVLEPAAWLVGAQAVAIRGANGEVLASWQADPDGRGPSGSEPITLDLPNGSLVVRASPYAPFFGDEELRLLRTLGALTAIALDRARLWEAERETLAALEQANEVKTNFVASAAHELRTPMTGVLGFAMTLEHLHDRLAPEQQAHLRSTLVQEAQRMTALIEQLLDLSRLDSSAIEIRPSPLLLRAELERIVEVAALEEGVDVLVPEDVVALVDRNALERIVVNLLSNASRYGSPPVRVGAERNGSYLRIDVEDGGSGVDPAFVPYLFERFSRSEDSRGKSATGTGLGLAIARAYARAHGGDLLYEPAAGGGARFRLLVPLAQHAELPVVSAPAAAGEARSPLLEMV